MPSYEEGNRAVRASVVQQSNAPLYIAWYVWHQALVMSSTVSATLAFLPCLQQLC
jgi:hypothetical protein